MIQNDVMNLVTMIRKGYVILSFFLLLHVFALYLILYFENFSSFPDLFPLLSPPPHHLPQAQFAAFPPSVGF
jgi:hypothetical protein